MAGNDTSKDKHGKMEKETKKSERKSAKAGENTRKKKPFTIFDALLYVYTIAFIILRGGELAYLLEETSFWNTVLTTGFFVWYLQLSHTLYLKLMLLVGIYVFDTSFYEFPDTYPLTDLKGKAMLVTGANSGVGFQTAFQAAKSGAIVYLACRNYKKCVAAAKIINTRENGIKGEARVLEGKLELSSFESIKEYAELFHPIKLDILVNNAGFGLQLGASQTVDGFEQGFGAMHLGHHYLTKLLIEQRDTSKNPLRVVNVASGTHYICLTLDCFNGRGDPFRMAITGKSDPLSYWRAKMANVLHAYELPRRYKGISSFSVNLGFVGTNINSLTDLALIKLQRDAEVGARPILWAAIVKPPSRLNGYIIDDVYGITHPLIPYNVPLYYVFKLLGYLTYYRYHNVQLFPDYKIQDINLRKPHSIKEVKDEAKWLYDFTEELLGKYA